MTGKSIPIGHLDFDADHWTLYRLTEFLLAELTRELDAPNSDDRRVDRLRTAYRTVGEVSSELRVRGFLRSPTMFSAVDDPTVSGVRR